MYEERNKFYPNDNGNYHVNNNEMYWNNYSGQGYFNPAMMEAERKAIEKAKIKKVITTILAIMGGLCFLFMVIFMYVVSLTSSEMESTELVEEPVHKETFTVKGYNFVVNADEGWDDILGLYSDEDNPFDMQLFNWDSSLGFFVEAYKKFDLDEGITAENFKDNYKSGLGMASDIKEIEPNSFFYEDDSKAIYSCIFSLVEDGEEFYYYGFAIDLKESDEMLWVMSGGSRIDFMENKKIVEEMVMEIE